jgi:hypothetical protein
MAIINRGGKSPLIGTVIAVDALTETVLFCSPDKEGSALTVNSVPCPMPAFGKDFIDALGETVKQQIEADPNLDVQKVSLLLPDQLFLLDTVTVPIIHRKAMQQSLSIAVESIYRNAEELNLMTYAVAQSKQSMTFGLVGARRDLLDQSNNVFVNAGAPISGTTFVTNATVNGAMELNAKLRGETFLLMDVKRDCVRYAFVIRGCTMGYFDMPFGWGIMSEVEQYAEDTLFDHHAAERAVREAKERARAKEMGAEAAELTAASDVDFELSADNHPKKVGRKLPGFMQRPAPQTPEECVYENFRVFLKWGLELINNNRDLTSLAKVDTVYINMPEKFRFLFDIIKSKHEGRGVTFAPLLPEGTEVSFADNLELYGGFFLTQYNGANTF